MKSDLSKPETYFPLRLKVCADCWLVQTEDYASAGELFSSDYAYFSSTSSSWVEHAARYSSGIIHRLGLNRESFVIEVASNDGYLLKNFVSARIPCLGIEPTASTAAAAESAGIPVLREFFGEALGKRLKLDNKQADLIIGNNVFAHVPDLSDFARGLKAALKPGGTVTLEFPHLLRLVEEVQFDTVYHEHFSYFSLYTVIRILESVGLRIIDVDRLTTHGGSLRVYGCHVDDKRVDAAIIETILDEEKRRGLQGLDVYLEFQKRADAAKDGLLRFLMDQKCAGRRIGAYGAAAKGNTLLNYAGVKPDLLPFVCDAAPSKQGKFLPGSHIPILPPSAMKERQPGLVLILPWNIADEVVQQHGYIKDWAGRFVVAMPEIRYL